MKRKTQFIASIAASRTASALVASGDAVLGFVGSLLTSRDVQLDRQANASDHLMGTTSWS